MIHNFEESNDFTDSMSFGELLKKKRRLLGLNQDDFGEVLGGYNQKTISRWENGLNSPPIEEARVILDFLGFDLKVPVYEGEVADDKQDCLKRAIDNYIEYGTVSIAG